MAEFFTNYFSEMISFVAGLIGGVAITVSAKRVSGKGVLVDQSGATAGQDIIGGNKTTK